MDALSLNKTFRPLLIVYGILTPVVVTTKSFLNPMNEIEYTMTDRRGYKMVLILDFKMSQDARHAGLRELGLRPLEYKMKLLPPGIFKVEVLNANQYDDA